MLPITEFYTHSRMLDGHLNKCKTCCKSDSKSNIEKNKLNPNWIANERSRCRKKQSPINKSKINSLACSEAKKNWRIRNKEKISCHSKVRRAIKNGSLTKLPCEICGDCKSEAHHDDYSQPLNVRWLCSKHHAEHHISIREKELFKKI